jgi:K+-transporting ATPase ATPase A chain
MTFVGVLNIAVFFLLILVLTKPLGVFMTKLFQGERTFLHPLLPPLERLTYRLCGIQEDTEQRWTRYAASLIAFSLVSAVLAYLIQRLQGVLPFNPMHFGTSRAPSGATPMTPDLAFNTAMSFVTNTNWQNHSGESTLSYFVQMTALTVQNFVSAAAGVAASVALIRGFARKQVNSIGNFWVDFTRGTLYIFLPPSLLGALFLCSQGVIQNFKPYSTVKTVEGATQTIAQGPVASQEAIKMVGTNGGGFFNANSAHPFENPTPLSNFVEMLMIFAVPAASLSTSAEWWVTGVRAGRAVRGHERAVSRRRVRVLSGRAGGNPQLTKLGLETQASSMQPGGNMEARMCASASLAPLFSRRSPGVYREKIE